MFAGRGGGRRSRWGGTGTDRDVCLNHNLHSADVPRPVAPRPRHQLRHQTPVLTIIFLKSKVSPINLGVEKKT